MRVGGARKAHVGRLLPVRWSHISPWHQKCQREAHAASAATLGVLRGPVDTLGIRCRDRGAVDRVPAVEVPELVTVVVAAVLALRFLAIGAGARAPGVVQVHHAVVDVIEKVRVPPQLCDRAASSPHAVPR